MRDRGVRTAVAVLTGLAVIYFGTTGRDQPDGEGVTSGLIALAVLAALLVWYLTRPRGDATK